MSGQTETRQELPHMFGTARLAVVGKSVADLVISRLQLENNGRECVMVCPESDLE
jgi:hypothetical protein